MAAAVVRSNESGVGGRVDADGVVGMEPLDVGVCATGGGGGGDEDGPNADIILGGGQIQ
jgi:hypothetical protein